MCDSCFLQRSKTQDATTTTPSKHVKSRHGHSPQAMPSSMQCQSSRALSSFISRALGGPALSCCSEWFGPIKSGVNSWLRSVNGPGRVIDWHWIDKPSGRILTCLARPLSWNWFIWKKKHCARWLMPWSFKISCLSPTVLSWPESLGIINYQIKLVSNKINMIWFDW